MKVGDLVRFAKWEDIIDINDWSTTPKKNIGMLVAYDHLMKTATILCEGRTFTSRAALVQKAGRKD
jgi:hypothetical protein